MALFIFAQIQSPRIFSYSAARGQFSITVCLFFFSLPPGISMSGLEKYSHMYNTGRPHRGQPIPSRPCSSVKIVTEGEGDEYSVQTDHSMRRNKSEMGNTHFCTWVLTPRGFCRPEL